MAARQRLRRPDDGDAVRIPAFFVFHGAKRFGRISQWPGTQAFVAEIEKIRANRGQGGIT